LRVLRQLMVCGLQLGSGNKALIEYQLRLALIAVHSFAQRPASPASSAIIARAFEQLKSRAFRVKIAKIIRALPNDLTGKVSYLSSVDPEHGEQLKVLQIERALARS
jgi:hypothetical protein